MAVTNLEVAQQVVLDPIESISDRAGIPREALLPYGRHIAKVDLAFLESIRSRPEGRLVLADGLTYAKQLGCTHLIDAATLTGACVVALGMTNAGAFSNDDETYARFEGALATSGDRYV